jgi:hypothetical protein
VPSLKPAIGTRDLCTLGDDSDHVSFAVIERQAAERSAGKRCEELRGARDQRVLIARRVAIDGERDKEAGRFEACVVARERG